MEWTIYCHIHVDTGRRYIGLTQMTMMQRWNRHVYSARRLKQGRPVVTSHFPNAIRMYGKDAFAHEVLEICNSLEAANLAEEKWIQHFDTRNPAKGFNLAKGGEHKTHPIRKNPWDDPEYRARQVFMITTRANTPAAKTVMSIRSKEIHSRPEVNQALRDLWKDPDRRARMVQKPATHCRKGHEYTPENTFPLRPGQGKKCRTCDRLRKHHV